MLKTWLLASTALVGCWTSKDVEKPAKADVSVELSAVTLADDCGDASQLQPPATKRLAAAQERALPASPAIPAPAKEPARREPPSASAVPADCAAEGCGGSRYACEPTSMQLSVRSSMAEPTAIAIKKVELLDKNGLVLGVLTPRTPSKWNGSAYETWDQQIAPSTSLSASYRLSAPLWHEIVDGGRWEAHTKTFQLRVTVGVGSGERTVEKKAITVAMMEPPVPT
jgi:hypothetical protein